jgi:hypothetical protein
MSGEPEDLLQARIDRALAVLDGAWHCEDCLVLEMRETLRGES